MKSFCYLRDRVNAIGWVKFKESGQLLNSKRLSLKTKGMVYRSCVRSGMLHGSETWHLKENEMAVLRSTERAMVRAMYGVKLMEKEDRGPNGDVGIEGNSGSDGNGGWSEMVQACVEEG